MTEVWKLHGLHNTGMTMNERFTLLSRQTFRRGKVNPLRGRSLQARGKGRTHPAVIEAIINQLNQAQMLVPEIPFRGRGRGRGGRGLRRYGSEGSLRSLPGLQRERSNSFGHINQMNKDQRWRKSNNNLGSDTGSVNGSVHSARSVHSHGYWLRGDQMQRRGGRGGVRAFGWARGRSFRGRVHGGRVNRVEGQPAACVRPARGSGRRGMRRNTTGPAVRGQGSAQGFTRGWGRGRGRGIFRSQTPKVVPTKEELDAQLDQYMAGTKAALDKELEDYMRDAMDFE